MSRKKNYSTKQGEAILDYIASLDGAHVTVEQIAAHFESQDAGVGLTTIYRQLDKLVKNGNVRKYVIDGITGACYQYISAPNQENFHLKCENCGELTHLKCATLGGVSEHIFDHHDFQINQSKTVFYGKCKKCI